MPALVCVSGPRRLRGDAAAIGRAIARAISHAIARGLGVRGGADGPLPCLALVAGSREERLALAVELMASTVIEPPEPSGRGEDLESLALAMLSAWPEARAGAMPRASALAEAAAARRGPGASGIALVGLMAAGKSETGAALARLAGLDFVDLDAEIAREAGAGVAEIFRAGGESAFRLLERRALARVVGAGEPVVLATGGGAVLDAGNREILDRDFATVWLHLDSAVAARRARAAESAGAPARPLLAGEDPAERLRALARERGPLYAAASRMVIRSDRAGPAELAEAVHDEVYGRG